MASHLENLTGSLLSRQTGKVRKVLFCNDGDTVVVGGSFPRLIIWDTQNPENSDIHARSLELCLGDPASTVGSEVFLRDVKHSLIFAHEVDTGAQFYDLETCHPTQNGFFEAKTPGVSVPVGFAPGSPFAILGSQDKIQLIDTRSFSKKISTAEDARSKFKGHVWALDAVFLPQKGLVRVVAAVMPKDGWGAQGERYKHGWSMRVFHFEVTAHTRPGVNDSLPASEDITAYKKSPTPSPNDNQGAGQESSAQVTGKRKATTIRRTSVSKKMKSAEPHEEGYSVQDRAMCWIFFTNF
ncbi:hypothetical protein L208DRAFT_1383134 [Tricholoma matsutake]|nr:hypothetical protein L208DRAFT_1383134 [Tricholoma matsutake 945]